jgi:predicted  nucleic acid-binding Zn-ribbon protein
MYLRIGLWLLTLTIIVLLGVSVFDLRRFADTLESQLTVAHQQIERLRAASTFHSTDRESAARERERVESLEASLARASAELDRWKMMVASVRPPSSQDRDPDLPAAYEEIERLKADVRAAARTKAALAAENARGDALTRELADVRIRLEELEGELVDAAGSAEALQKERERADNLAREAASSRQELEQLKKRDAAAVSALARDLQNAERELERLRTTPPAGLTRPQSERAPDFDQTNTMRGEPTPSARSARPRITARSDERGVMDQPNPVRSADARRAAPPPASNPARVTNAQGRRFVAEPPKPRHRELPEELRPVW